MELYIYLLLIILFFLAIKTKKTFIVCGLLILLTTFRSFNVGVDTLNYYMIYENDISRFSISSLIGKIEIGWLYLNVLVQELFGDFKWLLFFSSILTIVPLNYVFKRDSEHPILAILFYVLLFYYFFSYSIIRQAIATSFFMLAIHFLIQKKNGKFLIAILIGALFHYSILFLTIFIWILNRINISFKWLIITLFISFILGISGVFELGRSYLAWLPFDKYANYESYNVDVEFNRVANYLFTLPKSMIFLYMVYLVNKNKLTIESMKIKLFWLGLVILNLFLAIPQISRFSLYLTIFEVLIMVNLYSTVNRRNRVEVISIFIIYSLVYFIYYSSTNRFGVIPYEF